ncbi:MAG: zinc ribbon domain-containing protein, partial [Clostridia bacterium]|nr:zinc ribbon domain-containing protein [Clostridia bacterium]
MAKKCPACNADNRDDARVCEYCGTKFPASDPGTVETPERKRFCTSCGKELPPDAAFCVFCGAKVNDPASQTRMPRQDPSPARQTPASQG